jgi:hypothetical protein
LYDTATNSSAWTFNGQALRLGDSVDTFWNEYVGLIDDVRIYNRALSPAEIAALYLGTVGTITGANCANPAAPEGTMLYNDTSNVMQYCNGTNWIGVGK